MPDDNLYRELNLRVTKLEDTVSEIAGVLADSPIFKDPSLSERLANIAVATGAGFVGGFTAGYITGPEGALVWGGGGAFTGFATSAYSELAGVQANEKYAEIVQQIQTDKFFAQQVGFNIFAELYRNRVISDEGLALAQQRNWALVDEATSADIVGKMLQNLSPETLYTLLPPGATPALYMGDYDPLAQSQTREEAQQQVRETFTALAASGELKDIVPLFDLRDPAMQELVFQEIEPQVFEDLATRGDRGVTRALLEQLMASGEVLPAEEAFNQALSSGVLNQWLQEQLWAEDFYFQQVEFALGQGNVPSIEEVDEALLSPETADERMQQFAAVHPRLQGDIEGYKNWLLQEFIPLYDEVVAEREQTAENTAQKQEEETNGQEEAEQVQEITVTIDQLQTDLTQLSSQLDEHSEALRDVSFQFSVVDVRFDGLNGRLDGLNGQLAAIIAQLSSLGAQLGRLTDPYTAPERQAEPLPGTTVITQ